MDEAASLMKVNVLHLLLITMSSSYSDNSDSEESSIPAFIRDLDHVCDSSDETDQQNDNEPIDRYEGDEQQEICLFESKSYQEAIVRISERIVQDHCEVREDKRDILRVVFKCKTRAENGTVSSGDVMTGASPTSHDHSVST